MKCRVVYNDIESEKRGVAEAYCNVGEGSVSPERVEGRPCPESKQEINLFLMHCLKNQKLFI